MQTPRELVKHWLKSIPIRVVVLLSCLLRCLVMASNSTVDELWQLAQDGYGLGRPSEETEIHVFRVILKPSLDEKACTRSITLAGPLSDPNDTLSEIIEAW